jgi:hypothetical protein
MHCQAFCGDTPTSTQLQNISTHLDILQALERPRFANIAKKTRQYYFGASRDYSTVSVTAVACCTAPDVAVIVRV